jgi:hypothetical protein
LGRAPGSFQDRFFRIFAHLYYLRLNLPIVR